LVFQRRGAEPINMTHTSIRRAAEKQNVVGGPLAINRPALRALRRCVIYQNEDPDEPENHRLLAKFKIA
jgi:hypothetical protein